MKYVLPPAVRPGQQTAPQRSTNAMPAAQAGTINIRNAMLVNAVQPAEAGGHRHLRNRNSSGVDK